MLWARLEPWVFNFLQTESALITKNSKMLLFCFYN